MLCDLNFCEEFFSTTVPEIDISACLTSHADRAMIYRPCLRCPQEQAGLQDSFLLGILIAKH